MANLYKMVKGDQSVLCEFHQVPGFEAKGFTLTVKDIPASPDLIQPKPEGLVELRLGETKVLCEPHQVPRYKALGYKEVNEDEGQKDHQLGSGPPVGEEGPHDRRSSDLGLSRGRSGSDPETATADEQPQDVKKTPSQLVAASHIEKVGEAIDNLDHDDDSVWTKHGTPRTVALSSDLGELVTQDDIEKARPGFVRQVS